MIKLCKTANFYNDLGIALMTDGQLSEAIKVFEKAVQLKPNSAIYHYNLGEALSQNGSNKKAWQYFYNALKINPNISSVEKDIYKACCLKMNNKASSNPIFIVGCGHSGTSIMLNILGSHPCIYPISFESYILMKPPSEIEKQFVEWDNECFRQKKKRWIEKTPIHIFYIQKALAYQPNCHFILMIRDGRDVVCSLRKRNEYNNVSLGIQRWIYDNLAGLPYWSHSQVKVVRYEDLVVAPKNTLKDILSFLEETYTDSVLDYYKKPKLWFSSEIFKPEKLETSIDQKNLRNWQINQPLFDGRGRYQKELIGDDYKLFLEKAQKYMEMFGYVNK